MKGTDGQSDRGVALVMVLAVLAALLVLAVPFLDISTNEHAGSVAPYAKAQARDRASSLLAYARYMLELGNEHSEALQADDSLEGALRSTPDWDVAEEAHVPIDLLDSKGKPITGDGNEPLMHPLDPRGVTADLEVRDEQAYPNLLTSPPFLIAASLGRSTLSRDITDTDTEIPLADASGFPEKDGQVLINGEVIGYSARDGSTLTGCQRGLEGGVRASKHRADTWVIDDRARAIAMLPYKSPRAKGRWREPNHPTYVKEIALGGELALSANEVDRLLRDFTVHGRRFAAGRFGRKVPLIADVNPENYDGNGFVIHVASIDGFLPGTVVRITDGATVEYGMVARVRGQSFGRVTLHDPVQNAFQRNRTSVEPLLRHPVNINSAPRSVLYRLIEGLQVGRNGEARGTEARMDEDATAVVVEGIIDNRPIKSLKHFRSVLAQLSEGAGSLFFTEFQAMAVFRNAVDATDRNVATGTVPFCFESFDYYTVETAAVVNDQSGRELARAAFRERIHVSPLGLLHWSLDTQKDFDESLARARFGPWTCTHPYPTGRFESVTNQPYSRIPMMMYRFGNIGAMMARGNQRRSEEFEEDLSFEDGVFPHEEEGDVRLVPARLSSSGYNQHFDPPGFMAPNPTVQIKNIDPEGHRLLDGPYEINPRDPRGPVTPGGDAMQIGGRNRGRGRGGNRSQNNGALQGRNTLNPVRYDMWYRTGRSGGGGRQVVFQYANQSDDNDEISLYIDTDGALVGRVSGRTIDDDLDEMEEVAEVRWMPQDGAGFWKPETWYHLGLAYRGTKPDDLLLFVDGYARGKPRYQTRLTADFGVDDISFEVEDGENWPRRGVAMVGTEVVAFDRNGDSFDVIQFQGKPWGRGQRGTKILPHGAGTVVTLFGYSTAPRGQSNRSGIVIPRGGATLQDALGPPTVATFAHNATVTLQVPTGGGLTIPVQLKVHDPKEPGGNELTLLADSYGAADFDAFPASGGYIVICSIGPGLANAPVGGTEFARYTSRQGNVLVGLQSVPNPPNPTLLQGANTQQGGVSIDRLVHPIQLQGTGPVQPIQHMAAVFPVSIRVSDVTSLLEPRRASGNNSSGDTFLNEPLPAWDTDPEFVQLGTPNTSNLDAHEVEWIRYHHVDEEGHLLCDELRFIQAASGWIRSRHLGPGLGILGSHLVLNLVLPMRFQCGTDPFTDGRHSAGSEVVPCIRTVSHSRREAINVQDYQTNPTAPVTGQRWSAAGWGDVVTIEGPRGANRKQMTVAWAGIDEPERVQIPNPNGEPISIRIRGNYEGHGWIAFTTAVGQDYRQRGFPGNGITQNRDRYVRILKFPSGEMPDTIATGGRAFAGGATTGEVADAAGYIDELRVTPFQPDRYVLWSHFDMDLVGQIPGQPGQPAMGGGGGSGQTVGIDETTDEIPIARIDWMISNPRNFGPEPRFYILPDGRKILYEEQIQGNTSLPQNDAGLIMIDEEIIAFRSIGTGSGGGPALLDCERGFMNTIARSHGWGTNVVFLDFMNVTMLQGAMDATANRMEIADPTGFFRSGGTVKIDQEMIHFTNVEQRAFVMPWRIDEDGDTEGGLFRGRYGTQPQSHDAQAIVLEMPFRYWDRYADRQDAADMSWYGVSLDLPGAFFHQLRFDEFKPNQYVDIEVLVRTDPLVPWSADPGKTKGLFLFDETEEGEPSVIDTAGEGFSARVMFRYLSGAFDPLDLRAHGWKATPELRSLSLSYLDQTRVLTREELR